MAPKRSEAGEELELTGRPPDHGPIMAAGMLAAAQARPEKKDEEKMSLFWRVFGGTILSIVALVCLTAFNNLTSSITDLRADLNRANEARASAVADLRAEMAKSAEARADLLRKDEFYTRMTSHWDRMQTLQQQNNTQNAALTSLKTELEGIKDRLGRQETGLEGLRKDQTAAAEEMKKDVAALEVVKERMAGLTADLKASREELAKIRGEVDRNSAYDQERRERRDTQYKQIDEALKELAKGLQECREKLARLEGQYTPAAPPAAKKTTAPRTAPPAGKPTTPEPAPMPGEPKGTGM